MRAPSSDTPIVSKRQRVSQFGNIGGGGSRPGGIAAVIEDYKRWSFENYDLEVHGTYVPGSRTGSVAAYAGAFSFLSFAARKRVGVAHVHLSQRGSFIREGLLLVVCRLRRIPAVATVHGSEFESFANARPALVKAILRLPHSVIVLHAHAASQISGLLPEQRVVVVPNAAPLDAAPTAAHRRSQTSPLVLFAGEVGRRKGCDVLLAAWPYVHSRMPEARLQLLGAFGADFSPRSLPAGVEAPGPQPRSAVWKRLAEARCAVLPSRAEAFPIFILEAMSWSCPVIATRVAGVPELVGDAGIIVEAGEAEALAGAILLLLQEPELAEELGRRGSARVARLFAPRRVQVKLESEWANATKSRTARG